MNKRNNTSRRLTETYTSVNNGGKRFKSSPYKTFNSIISNPYVLYIRLL